MHMQKLGGQTKRITVFSEVAYLWGMLSFVSKETEKNCKQICFENCLHFTRFNYDFFVHDLKKILNAVQDDVKAQNPRTLLFFGAFLFALYPRTLRFSGRFPCRRNDFDCTENFRKAWQHANVKQKS